MASPSLSLPPGSIAAVTQRFAKAVAHPVRVEILIEHDKRDLSPALFTELKRGQADISEVARHFRVLERLGYAEPGRRQAGEDIALRHLPSAQGQGSVGGRKRGRAQSIYRPIQSAEFDRSSWDAIPRSRKLSPPGPTFERCMECVADALRAGTMDRRDDRHFTWTKMDYDQQAWTELAADTNALHALGRNLAAEANRRLRGSTRRAIPVTLHVAAFESPPTFLSDIPPSPAPTRAEASNPFLISPRLAKALAHPLRIEILVALNRCPMSPRQFWDLFGGTSRLEAVAQQFRVLESLGCIELAGTRKPSRGRAEKIFRALQRSIFDGASWEAMPLSLRGQVTSVAFTTYIAQVAEAIEAGTMTVRDGTHLSLQIVYLDELAWTELIAATDAAFFRAIERSGEVSEREPNTARPIQVTVAFACFESPGPTLP